MSERRRLSSGYRWVVLRPGEFAHMLNVEHHWMPDPEIPGYSVFNFFARMSPETECGASTEGGKFHVSLMSALEPECCPDCWKLAAR